MAFDGKNHMSKKKAIKFNGKKIYGREHEVALLSDSYQRISLHKISEVFFLGGAIGVGKTHLLKQLQEDVLKNHACFCAGKFDQLECSQPFEAILDIVDIICHSLSQTDDLELVRKRLRIKCGGDLDYLISQVPKLRCLIGESDVNDVTSTMRLCSRFKSACRRFLKAVTEIHGPIVILFDDLDFSDQDSLFVIQSLISDKSLKHVLLIATYQDDTVKRKIMNTGKGQEIEWKMNHLDILPLRIGFIRSYMSHLTGVDFGNQIQHLSALIFEKTNGNPYFITELTKELKDEGIIGRFMDGNSHDELNEFLNSVDSVSCLWNKRILKLHETEQTVLKLASFLGFKFDGLFLEEAAKVGSEYLMLPATIDVKAILYNSSRKGVLRGDPDTSEYAFTHDIVQKALLNLRPNKNDVYKYVIGCAAKEKLQVEGVTKQGGLLFTAILNLNHVRQMVVDNADDQDIMVQLSLDASHFALLRNSFVAATEISHCGLIWANGGNWTTHYESTLCITNTLIKAYQERGCIDECKQHVDLVLKNAHCPEDKFEAFFNWIDCLQSKSKYSAIIDFCLEQLQGIGERLPRQPSKLQVRLEMFKINKRLKQRDFNSISQLPEMTDERKLVAVRLLSAIMLNSFFLQRRELLFLACSKSISITLLHGSCEMTAFTFACYGMILAFLKNQKGAYKFGQLANKFIESSQMKDAVSPATCIIAFSCLHWQQRSLDNLIAVLLKGYRIGNQVGDVKWAMLNGVTMIGVSLSCGRHLHELEDETRTFCHRMNVYDNYKDFLTLCYPLWQCILNLSTSNQTTENCRQTEDVMDQGELEVHFLETHNYTGLLILYGVYLQEALYFNSILSALEMAKKLEKYSKLCGASFACNQVKFFSALTYVRIDRGKKAHKFLHKVDKVIKDFKNITKNGTISCEPLLLLLQAERSSLRDNKHGLKNKYDDAISSAQALNMVHIQALANECAGLTFLLCDSYLSDHYLTEALEYYFQWGAMRKVEQLETEYASLLSRSRPKVVTSLSSSKGSSGGWSRSKGERSALQDLDRGLQLEKEEKDHIDLPNS